MLVTVLSWNVNNKEGVGDAIPKILGHTNSDMILISLQEHFDVYSSVIKPVLKMYPSYRVISVDRVFGLWSIVLSKERYTASTIRMGFGPLGLINKGVCVTKISNGVIFISCHLSAHQENNKKRLKEIRKIFECICDEESLKSTDTVILAGDMNFRISGGLKNLDYSKAKENDQCNEFKRAYPSFSEGIIDFKPTYKYIVATNELCSERQPSWCDRVFVSTSYTSTFNAYRSAYNVKISDHKPIVCVFEVGGKRIDRTAIPMVGYNGHQVIRGFTRFYCGIYEYRNTAFVCLLVLVLYLMLIRSKTIPGLSSLFRRFGPGAYY
ncbi:inositol polyphosphate-5-phosphatase [Encephalitozoon romaleae SJ-2008]|uniref:Inositol polyphosphate-5-phosphatase n=1 Tax=Encephalitozoon romaleae (strain SJ-2008) TaxID=1178016 RepID=I6ZW03_ENCRO|nr:inositol polyphosphate-5-phosphatase [Encephalitozoon romaleae SJ-2008]AFN83941.1 inositol polyphosphate-5-phosphatase [Encephalitozoon romaleae SJ-2008]